MIQRFSTLCCPPSNRDSERIFIKFRGFFLFRREIFILFVKLQVFTNARFTKQKSPSFLTGVKIVGSPLKNKTNKISVIAVYKMFIINIP